MTVQTPAAILFDRNLILQREYWRNQLHDPDCAAGILPDFPRPTSYAGAMHEISFTPDGALVDRIIDLARGNDLLLYTIVVSCCKVLIHTYSEANRIAVGSPARGSDAPRNALPMISHIEPEMVMRDVLSAELEVIREGYKHQDWPYERMLKEIGLSNDLSKCRLFDLAILLTNMHGPLPDVRNDITISMTRESAGLSGTVFYQPEVYAQRSIERFADFLCRTIAWAVEDPGRTVAELSLINEAEQQHIIEEINNTTCAFADDVCFMTLFEAQVAKAPQAPALVSRDRVISYMELNRQVNTLAGHLIRTGLSRGQIVGIYFDRSPEGIVAILAVLKAGGVYLPLDADYPKERLTFMVDDAQVSLILTDREQIEWLDELDTVTALCTETINADGVADCTATPVVEVSPDDNAYLIYTSGSTGIPKGALNGHRGLRNLTAAHIEAFELTPQSRVLQFASWSFDAMVSELVMSLGSGACMCLCPAEEIIPGLPLVEVVNELQITHVTLPPAALQYMEPDDMPSLTHIITAGDFCPPEQIRRWTSAKVFYNAYGVTEATVCSTIASLSADDTVQGVGRPMTNATVYILDSHKRMVPVGFPGELYLGGTGVAKGYLNREELTTARFMVDPYSKVPGGRMYRSGDRGRFLEDGSVELLGRIDKQIKIRGFRIEPGEIEHVLEQHPAVRNAVVLPCREGTSLAAFLEVPDSEPDTSALSTHCTAYLPYFMVPSSWHLLSAFPLNPNGKIDRKALVELASADQARARECASPRNSLELELVGIWQEILDTDAVGIREDFFELGGHSLLAIRLLALLQQRISVKMTFADIIENPTIEKLAAHIHDGTHETIPFSHVVHIQPKGQQRPLFCIHPGGGNVQGYLDLARLLGEDQPLYGIQAAGFENGQEVIENLDTMAQRYVKALRTIQPTGPYAIIGWCFGGRAAFACAETLRDQGQAVEYLAFLDAYAPHVIPETLKQSDDATLWESLLSEDTPVSAEQLRMYTPEEQITRVISLAKEADLIPGYYSDEQAKNVMRVFRANSRIVQTPIKSPYPGRLELFKAEDEAKTALLFTSDPTLGWQDVFTEPVTVTVVPGNHNTLVRQPHVQVLAGLISSALEKVRAGGREA
jgi:amino acid adenylation domain-containing protein